MGSDFSLAQSTATALAEGQLGTALVAALIGGLLTALSPCVYPLIPITISVFGAREASSKLQSFGLALMYTAGMVLLYAVLGTSFASAGKVFGTLLANRWVVLGFAGFCAAMAASMLGAFEIRVPSALQTRLSTVGGKGYRGAFVMGLVSGLIAAPCTGPVLSVLLTFIASTKDVTLGFLLMLAFGVGLGLPFLVLATFSSAIKRMPRSGAWMDWVKAVLGVAMIALALYYLQFAVPLSALNETPRWLPWLLVVFGLGIGAIHLSVHGTPWHEKARKVGGAIAVGAGAFMLLLLAPPPQKELRWEKDLGAALARAKAEHKPAMIDFFADWCGACVELDEKTFSKPEVTRALSRFVLIKIDGTTESPEITTLYDRFGVKGLPTVAFVASDGATLNEPRITGFLPPAAFLPLLDAVK
jgi:thiol:disulfide interchange protein DsbD